jgi:hypothetical protein
MLFRVQPTRLCQLKIVPELGDRCAQTRISRCSWHRTGCLGTTPRSRQPPALENRDSIPNGEPGVTSVACEAYVGSQSAEGRMASTSAAPPLRPERLTYPE